MSKRPSQYAENCPKKIEYASGCRVYSGKDKEYIDYTCALGAISLGYGFPPVDYAVSSQIQKGILYGLSSPKEAVLAQKLIDLIPCAEMVRFLKTGSEACSAAVKIAKSYTGRNGIASYGYHGWHEWENRHEFEYNDLNLLTEILKYKKVAAVIIEPYVYDPPANGYLMDVINLAHKYGALVIFDEIVTGFRTLGWSAQKFFKVIPDLTTLGKGMGNGYPISAVVGKKKYMKELEKKCFVSSTFGGDLIGISAAIATIDYMKKHDVINHIWAMGTDIREWFNITTREFMLPVCCKGYACRTTFEFPLEEAKQLFWRECLKRRVLFGKAQFISYSHKVEEIDTTIKVIQEALMKVKEVYGHCDSPGKNKVRKTARKKS